MDAVTFPPAPVNEPNLTYAPGSPEREALEAEIDRLERKQHDLKAHIGGTPAGRAAGRRSRSSSRTTTSTCSAC